ncbi:MAG: response regulator [Pseudomonadota bacterium]|nr:response regulator [Pseudomonadota bacterium]
MTSRKIIDPGRAMHPGHDRKVPLKNRARPRGSAGRLLIVDDDDSLSAILALHLLDNGIEVTRAEDYSRARQLFKPGSFEFALLDYQLPDGSGLELGLELRREDPRIRLLVMTGCAESGLERQVAESGIQTFLRKPFLVRDLDTALATGRLARPLGPPA